MEALVILIALLLAARWVMREWFPEPTRLAESIISTATRLITALVWRVPRKHLGAPYTLWLWLCAVALMVTLFALPDARGLRDLAPTIALWLLAYGGWGVLGWWHRRHFTPRALPRRNRR